MKLRLGFVTNSSSSSFIISKKSFGRTLSLDIVLQYIQMMLSEVEEAVSELVEEATIYGYESLIEDYLLPNNEQLYDLGFIDEHLSRYGISVEELVGVYRFIHDNHWILEAEGYTDYERLRKENCESTRDYEDGWPFVIYNTNIDNDSTLDISEYYNEECKKSINQLNELGEICIHSRDCWLPSYVVDRLKDISVYGCSHIG